MQSFRFKDYFILPPYLENTTRDKEKKYTSFSLITLICIQLRHIWYSHHKIIP